MQHVLVSLQYEEETSYSTLIKCNFNNITLDSRDRCSVRHPLCTTLCPGVIEI